jgi:integrase
VAQRLADELAAARTDPDRPLTPELEKALLDYRPLKADAPYWAQVRDLVQLGMAAHRPTTDAQVKQVGWALHIHAGWHHGLGTSRTVTGWYGTDAVESTLSTDRLATAGQRSLAGWARRLRAISARLVPTPATTAAAHRYYPPHAPYSTKELAGFLDWADAQPLRLTGERVALLVFLIVGTGMTDAELCRFHGSDLVAADRVALAHIRGHNDRVVPVHHSCEAALLTHAAVIGDQPFFPGLDRTSGLGSRIVELARNGRRAHADLPPLTVNRLRATHRALLVASGAPLPAVLRATGLAGDRSLGHLLDQVQPLDENTYRASVRGATHLLPLPGQLLLPGTRHPAPTVPLLPPGIPAAGPR